MKFQSCFFKIIERTDALTDGYLLGIYSVREIRQESVSIQQIPDNCCGINLILSKVALLICKLGYSRNDF